MAARAPIFKPPRKDFWLINVPVLVGKGDRLPFFSAKIFDFADFELCAFPKRFRDPESPLKFLRPFNCNVFAYKITNDFLKLLKSKASNCHLCEHKMSKRKLQKTAKTLSSNDYVMFLKSEYFNTYRADLVFREFTKHKTENCNKQMKKVCC